MLLNRVAPCSIVLSLSSLLTATLFLNGCSVQDPAPPSAAAPGAAITGRVNGGQQPVSGAHIYLYAASTSGYSGTATSLLNSPGYVTSDSTGAFSISGDYTCPSGGYVYLLAVGGNPGLAPGTNNQQLALLAGLGACSALTPSTIVAINEVTTVATAYALAQFTTSETQIGTSATNIIGLQNAFATIPNLVSPSSGTALPTTPAGNGTVPQAEINALANALAACVNTDGTGSPCSTLMSAAAITNNGASPIDTAQAAINIAQNPGRNVSAIYAVSTPSAPFQPTLASAPGDWSLTIFFNGSFGSPQNAAIDANGNLWMADRTLNALDEMSPVGVVLSGSTGYTNSQMFQPHQVAIDASGNAWVDSRHPTTTSGSLQEFNASGNTISGANGFSGGGLRASNAVAVDSTGNIWVAGAVLSEFTGAGVPVSATGYSGGGYGGGFRMAFDQTGSIWIPGASFDGVTGAATSFLARFSSAGVPLSPSSGYTGGGMAGPRSVAIDANGTAWISNMGANLYTPSPSLSSFSSAGIATSPAIGYPVPGSTSIEVMVDGNNNIWAFGDTLFEMSTAGTTLSTTAGYGVLASGAGGTGAAIDASGNIWITGGTASAIGAYEVVGIAGPVVTPVVKAVAANKLGHKP